MSNLKVVIYDSNSEIQNRPNNINTCDSIRSQSNTLDNTSLYELNIRPTYEIFSFWYSQPKLKTFVCHVKEIVIPHNTYIEKLKFYMIYVVGKDNK